MKPTELLHEDENVAAEKLRWMMIYTNGATSSRTWIRGALMALESIGYVIAKPPITPDDEKAFYLFMQRHIRLEPHQTPKTSAKAAWFAALAHAELKKVTP